MLIPADKYLLRDSEGREYEIRCASWPLLCILIRLTAIEGVVLVTDTEMPSLVDFIRSRGLLGPQLIDWIDNHIDPLVLSARTIRHRGCPHIPPTSQWGDHPLLARILTMGYALDTTYRRLAEQRQHRQVHHAN